MTEKMFDEIVKDGLSIKYTDLKDDYPTLEFCKENE